MRCRVKRSASCHNRTRELGKVNLNMQVLTEVAQITASISELWVYKV